jgi:hypothetical protein
MADTIRSPCRSVQADTGRTTEWRSSTGLNSKTGHRLGRLGLKGSDDRSLPPAV